MSHITIRWDGSEAEVVFKPSFKRLYDVARLDCLRDALWELQNAYSRELDSFHHHQTNNKDVDNDAGK